MIKTGYEIIGMIKDGKAPNKIKINDNIYEFQKEYLFYQNEDMKCIDLIKCLNDEFEIIEDKVWKPKNKDYWFITDDVNVMEDYWSIDVDELRYELGNCFKTEKEANKMLEKIKIYMQLKRYAEEHNTEKVDWNNGKDKYQIGYDFTTKTVRGVYTMYCIKTMNGVYFSSEEICEQAIQEIGENNIKKLFEEE